MFEFDRATEILKSPEESMDGLVFVAAFEVLGSEVVVRDVVAEHVPGGSEHGSGDGKDGLFLGPRRALRRRNWLRR
jgi:hypothetical protein